MNNLLGINSDCIKDGVKTQPETQTLNLIKEIGFNCFFTSLFHENEVEELKNKADKLGLKLTYIHAPFKGVNTLWEEGADYEFIYNNLITTIDSASKNAVPTIVMHVSSTWRPPKISQIGLNRFDALVNYAVKKGVNIAFENLRLKEYLDVVMSRYKSLKNVGFCYDFGHESCFDGCKNLYLPEYGERLIATHIHDNHGRTVIDDTIKDDKHYLPLDGDIDYKTIFTTLKTIGYKGPLTLEVTTNTHPNYKKLRAKEFLTLALSRLKSIIE